MARQSVANLTPQEVRDVVESIQSGNYDGIRRYAGVDYVGMRETAYMVKLHYTTVRNYTVNGTFPSKKFGRLYFVDWRKSLELINSGSLADVSANAQAE